MILERLIVTLGLDDREVRTKLKQTDKEFQELDRSVRTVATRFATYTAAVGAAAFGLERLTTRGGRSLAVLQGFESRVRGAGRALDGMTASARHLVGETELVTQFNLALQLGAARTTEDFEKLAEAALVLGRVMGVDTSRALESLVTGIGRQSVRWLDNLGILVDVREANRRYADQLGKVASELTEAEQKEAFRIAATREATRAMEALGGATLNAGDSFRQLRVEIGNTFDAFGRHLARDPLLQDLVGGLAQGVRLLRGEVGTLEDAQAVARARIQQRLTQQLGFDPGFADSFFPQSTGDAIGEAADQMARFRQESEELAELVAGVREFEETMATLELRLGAIADISPRALSSFEALTGLQEVGRRRNLPPGDFARTAGGDAISLFGGIDRSQEARDRFAEWVGETADGLEALHGSAEGSSSALDDFSDGFLDQFDSGEFLSNLGANLASSAITAVMGAFSDALFGPQHQTILQENTRALEELADSLEGTFSTGSDVGDALLRAFHPDVAEDVGRRQQFQAREDLLRRRFEATDAGTEERFRGLQQLLMQSVGGGFAPIIATLNPDNIDEFLTNVLDSIQAGTFDPELLGVLTADQFLDLVGELENLGDATNETADAMRAVANTINAPSGFKVALARFNATDVGGGIDGTPFLPAGAGVGPGRGGDVNIGEVNIQAARGDDGRELYRKFTAEARRQAALGGADDFTLAAQGRL